MELGLAMVGAGARVLRSRPKTRTTNTTRVGQVFAAPMTTTSMCRSRTTGAMGSGRALLGVGAKELPDDQSDL